MAPDTEKCWQRLRECKSEQKARMRRASMGCRSTENQQAAALCAGRCLRGGGGNAGIRRAETKSPALGRAAFSRVLG